MKLLSYVIFACTILILSCQTEDTTVSKTPKESATGSQVNYKGKALFQANCASCHNPLKEATGPALKGALSRSPGKEWIYKFVNNPAKMIADGDQYANEIFLKWNKTAMTPFPDLSKEDIDAIMEYCDHFDK